MKSSRVCRRKTVCTWRCVNFFEWIMTKKTNISLPSSDHPRQCQRVHSQSIGEAPLQRRVWKVQIHSQLHRPRHVDRQPSRQQSCTWAGLYVPPRLVLLHPYDSWINSQSERLKNQRLVASTSLHLDRVGCHLTHLAARWTLANVPDTVHVLQCLHQLHTVHPIRLSEGLALST